jgi:DNA-binding transcriptional regulator YiaG
MLSDVPKGIERATSRAVNKTLTTTRAEMVRLIRQKYAIKAGDIRAALNISMAKPNKLEGKIFGESSPGIPLIKFARTKKVPSTRRTKAGAYSPAGGISVLIRKDRGKRIVKGAFLAKMTSGHIGAFERVNRSKKQRFTPEQKSRALALRRSLGSATAAAKALGMSVKTLRNWALSGTAEGARGRTLADNRRIEELYGPTPIKLLSSEENIEYIEDFCDEKFQKNLAHEADFYLQQQGLK